MKRYSVTRRIILEHIVAANSAKEAQELARDMGQKYAEFTTAGWKAKLLK